MLPNADSCVPNLVAVKGIVLLRDRLNCSIYLYTEKFLNGAPYLKNRGFPIYYQTSIQFAPSLMIVTDSH